MTSLGMHMWWNFCYVLRYEGKSAQCPGKGFLVLKREGFALFLSSWTLYHYKGVVWSWSFGSHLGIQKDLSTKGWLCRKKGIVWPWMMLTNLTTLPPLPSAFFIWGNTIPFLFFFFPLKAFKMLHLLSVPKTFQAPSHFRAVPTVWDTFPPDVHLVVSFQSFRPQLKFHFSRETLYELPNLNQFSNNYIFILALISIRNHACICVFTCLLSIFLRRV